MSKVRDYPKHYRLNRMEWIFRVMSKTWFTDKCCLSGCEDCR